MIQATLKELTRFTFNVREINTLQSLINAPTENTYLCLI